MDFFFFCALWSSARPFLGLYISYKLQKHLNPQENQLEPLSSTQNVFSNPFALNLCSVLRKCCLGFVALVEQFCFDHNVLRIADHLGFVGAIRDSILSVVRFVSETVQLKNSSVPRTRRSDQLPSWIPDIPKAAHREGIQKSQKACTPQDPGVCFPRHRHSEDKLWGGLSFNFDV